MSNEVLEITTENGLTSVNVDDIPGIITSSIDGISKLEDQIRAAEKDADEAMNYAHKEVTYYKEKGVWFFKYRSIDAENIIEYTQEAVVKLAKAQQVSVEALKQSFEFQKKLAETSKYLFDLGCANITVNRIAVRAIELKLSGASKETLSELAKQEMMAVVKQLKEQEDILKKQEFLHFKVKEHATRLGEKDRIDAEQTHRLEELMALLKNNDLIIDKNSEAIKILIEYTKQKDLIDKEQSNEITALKNVLQQKLCTKAIVISLTSLVCCIAVVTYTLLR